MNEVIEEILGYLKTAMGDKIKTYYHGEVALPPKSYIPCLMVFGTSTRLIAKSTAKDQLEYDILIRVVIDVNDHFKEKGVKEEKISAMEQIIDLMEERNSDGTLKNDTVLGTLRDNVTGTDYLFNNNVEITYERLQSGEYPYVKADMSVTAITDLIQR